LLEEEEPLPAKLMAFQRRAHHSMEWVWGMVLALAATGVYALYSGYVQPWQQQLEQAGFGGTNLLNLLIFQGAFWKGWQSMMTFVEVLALMTLGGVALVFFGKRLRRGSALALVFTGFVFVSSMSAPSATATDVRHADSVTIAQDETVRGDLYILSDHARIDGTVEGDIFIFSEDVSVSGHVKGDVIAFAQSMRVTGQVDGNIRSCTNNMTVSGKVARNILTLDELVNLDPAAKVDGSLTAFVKKLNLDGRLGRDLLVFSEHTTISGAVAGAVDAKGDGMTIGPKASVDGHVKFQGNNAPDVSPEAKLGSGVEFHKLEHESRHSHVGLYLWQLIWAAAYVLFGLVLFFLMPKFSYEAVTAAESWPLSVGLGLLVFISVPIMALIACLTVVGLFIGISAFSLWCAALTYSQIVMGAVVGQWLAGKAMQGWSLIGRMAMGLVFLRLLMMIPYAGIFVKMVVVIWGLGATSLALYRRFQPPITPGAPLAPTHQPLPPATMIGGPQPA
jgi:cytoskeletal protein CcmA (bactofilin family)